MSIKNLKSEMKDLEENTILYLALLCRCEEDGILKPEVVSEISKEIDIKVLTKRFYQAILKSVKYDKSKVNKLISIMEESSLEPQIVLNLKSKMKDLQENTVMKLALLYKCEEERILKPEDVSKISNEIDIEIITKTFYVAILESVKNDTSKLNNLIRIMEMEKNCLQPKIVLDILKNSSSTGATNTAIAAKK